MSLLRSWPLLLPLLMACIPLSASAQSTRVLDNDLEPVRRCHAAVLATPAESLRIAEAVLASPGRSDSVEAGALTCRGLAQKNLGDGDGVADTLTRLLALAQRPGLPKRDRRAVLHTAQTLLSERGETMPALQILQQLLDEAVADNDVQQQIVVLVGLASTHSQGMGDDEGALGYLDRAIALSDAVNRAPHPGDAMLRYNRAFALMSLQRYDAARPALQDAERLARRVGGQELLLHRIDSHRAELERLQGHLDSAEKQLQRILPWQADKDPQGQIVTLQRLARIALARNAGDHALDLAEQAMTLAERSHMIGEIRSTLELLFEVQSQRGDTAAALATGRQLRDLDRSRTRGQALERLARLQHRTDQSLPSDGADRGLLERRDRLLRNAAITALVLVLLLVVWLQRHNQRLRQRLQRLGRYDRLTSLLNRAEAERRLTTLPQPVDPARRVALLRIDIEHFKEFNDRHGQHAGDQALRLLADVLRELSDEQDLLARWSGSSLLVARADTSHAAAIALAAHLQSRLSALPLILPGGGSASLPIAIGLAPLPLFAGGSADPADSLRALDRCLQHVAAQGGSHWAALWGIADADQVQVTALLRDPAQAARQGQVLLDGGGLSDWTDAATSNSHAA